MQACALDLEFLRLDQHSIGFERSDRAFIGSRLCNVIVLLLNIQQAFSNLQLTNYRQSLAVARAKIKGEHSFLVRDLSGNNGNLFLRYLNPTSATTIQFQVL